jgi:hypothetical protein
VPTHLPAYVGSCISGGFIFGVQVCVDVTKGGSIYVTPSVGVTTPGVTGSLHAGYIHGISNPFEKQIDSYLHGPSLGGSVSGGFSYGEIWGKEGRFGNCDFGNEFGVGWPPGASIMQGYGFRLPINAPSW